MKLHLSFHEEQTMQFYFLKGVFFSPNNIVRIMYSLQHPIGLLISSVGIHQCTRRIFKAPSDYVQVNSLKAILKQLILILMHPSNTP
jgi:hypothetical protein